MPIFSVIIPHYNSPDKLKRLLQTIEDSEDTETIIVDDNSTVDISKVKKIVANRCNTTFLKNNSTNKGAGGSRNVGIEHSAGEWLIFADADDYFLKGTWEYLKKLKDSNLDIIYFSPTSIEETTQQFSNRHIIYETLVNNYVKTPSLENELALKAKFIVPWSKMINKTLIQNNNIKFDEVLVSNDIMFSTKSGLSAENIDAKSHSIYCATKDAKTLSTNVSYEKFKIRTNKYIEYHSYLQKSLSKTEYLNLNIYGAGWLYRGISQGIPLKYILKTWKKMKKQNIQMIPMNTSIFDRVFQNIKKNLKEKKFLK